MIIAEVGPTPSNQKGQMTVAKGATECLEEEGHPLKVAVGLLTVMRTDIVATITTTVLGKKAADAKTDTKIAATTKEDDQEVDPLAELAKNLFSAQKWFLVHSFFNSKRNITE